MRTIKDIAEENDVGFDTAEDCERCVRIAMEEMREECAKVCEKMDAFTMSGTDDMRKYYRMGVLDAANEIRSVEII